MMRVKSCFTKPAEFIRNHFYTGKNVTALVAGVATGTFGAMRLRDQAQENQRFSMMLYTVANNKPN